MVYNEKAETTGGVLKVLLKGSLGMAPRDRGAADQKRNNRTVTPFRVLGCLYRSSSMIS